MDRRTLLLAFPASACATAATGATRDLEASVRALLEAMNARDLQRTLACFDPDIQLVYPGRPDADFAILEQNFARAFQPPPNFFAIDINRTQTSGDLGFVLIHWRIVDPSRDAPLAEERDLEVWRRRDGSWRLLQGLSFPVRR
jgi:ketosteroid isomerase-like protein